MIFIIKVIIMQVSQGILPLQAQGIEEGVSHILKCSEVAVVVKSGLQY